MLSSLLINAPALFYVVVTRNSTNNSVLTYKWWIREPSRVLMVPVWALRCVRETDKPRAAGAVQHLSRGRKAAPSFLFKEHLPSFCPLLRMLKPFGQYLHILCLQEVWVMGGHPIDDGSGRIAPQAQGGLWGGPWPLPLLPSSSALTPRGGIKPVLGLHPQDIASSPSKNSEFFVYIFVADAHPHEIQSLQWGSAPLCLFPRTHLLCPTVCVPTYTPFVSHYACPHVHT